MNDVSKIASVSIRVDSSRSRAEYPFGTVRRGTEGQSVAMRCSAVRYTAKHCGMMVVGWWLDGGAHRLNIIRACVLAAETVPEGCECVAEGEKGGRGSYETFISSSLEPTCSRSRWHGLCYYHSRSSSFPEQRGRQTCNAHLCTCGSEQACLTTHFSQNLRCEFVTVIPSSPSASMLLVWLTQLHQGADAGVSGDMGGK